MPPKKNSTLAGGYTLPENDARRKAMTPVLHTLFEKFQAYENVHNEYVKAHQELSDAFVEAFKLQHQE